MNDLNRELKQLIQIKQTLIKIIATAERAYKIQFQFQTTETIIR